MCKLNLDFSAWHEAPRSGFIEYVEIMDEEWGLLKFIRDTFTKSEAEKPVPDLRKDRDGWYRQEVCFILLKNMQAFQVGCANQALG